MDNHKVGYVHDGLEPDRQSVILTLDLTTRLKLIVDMARKWRYIDSGYFAVHFGKKVIYSGTSVARTLTARLPRLFRTRS